MKRITAGTVTIILSLLPAVVTVLADETGMSDVSVQQTQKKDECMLVARNCGNSVISIQDKIERLKEEIAKGRAVYTPEELNRLQQKLDDVSRSLDFLLGK